MKTFKILGLLLSYPEAAWLSRLGDCERVLLQEDVLPRKQLSAVLAFVAELKGADIYDLQEDYVATFDRGRSHCLHLFEHVHGDSRDRGQAMVNLAAAYEDKGLYIDGGELPDYLPLFLEFLSMCPADEALALLSEPIDIIATVGARLERRDSPYAALFGALIALSKVRPDSGRIRKALAESSEDNSLEALDKEWEEAAAFGHPPGGANCGGCASRPDGLDISVVK
jgi:nitrate reductase delta subunit